MRAAARVLGGALPALHPQGVLAAAEAALPAAALRLPWPCGAAGQWPRPLASSAKPGGEPGSGAAPSGDEGAADAAAAGSSSGDEAASVDVSDLQELLTKAQEEAASFKDRWQRSHAEMQNLIARQAREKETMQTYAVQKFAESLLEVADNLESAAKAVPPGVLVEGADVAPDKALGYLKSLLEGVRATERVLLKNMAAKGVQRIDTPEGAAFDPATQEAMSTMPCPGGDKQPGTIATVWQSGYKIHDRVLRAAKVIVFAE